MHKSWSMEEVCAQERREEGTADAPDDENDDSEDGEEGTGENADLLSRFMAVRDDHGNPLTDEQLRDVVMNMIMYAIHLSVFVLSLLD